MKRLVFVVIVALSILAAASVPAIAQEVVCTSEPIPGASPGEPDHVDRCVVQPPPKSETQRPHDLRPQEAEQMAIVPLSVQLDALFAQIIEIFKRWMYSIFF